MINSNAINSQSGADSYTDLSSLNNISKLKDKNQALEKIAQQFESMMIQMMMKSMRSANEMFAEGNFLSSSEGDTYQGMLDDQLSLTLSKGKGMGLAEVMVRQLKGRYGSTEAEPSKELPGIGDYLQYRNSAENASGLMSRIQALQKNTASEISPAASENVEFDGSVSQFVEHLYPMAEKAADVLGVAPMVLIAQSALETGWGSKISSQSGKSSFNMFNIKVGGSGEPWRGESVKVATLEYRQGVAVKEQASFRAYPSPEESFIDYAHFIRNSPRYEQALKAQDSASYIQGLSEAGYATDPDYAEKIMRILNSAPLQKAMAENAQQPAPDRG